MTNVISADASVDKHYLHAGFSATISSSYTSPAADPRGITWDGTNVLSSDRTGTDKHFLHSGFSASVTSSYTAPGTNTKGITWDGTNVISADSGADKHFLHIGFSASITSSYATAGGDPTGITWDGTNVISTGGIIDKHLLHSGFSDTITSSYASPAGNATGITWDGTNVISAEGASVDKHYLHSGFSDTITSSHAAPGSTPFGMTWDGRYVSGITAALTGTALPTATEAEIAAGGETVIITLTDDTWLDAGASFDGQRQAVIDGFTAATSPTNGWNNEVRDKAPVGVVVRTSATVATLTWTTAASAYDISSPETITVTIPAAALTTSADPVVADETFDVTVVSVGLAIPIVMYYYRQRRR